MNNEEKILALLVDLKESVDTRFDAVDRDVRLIYEGQDMLRQKLRKLPPEERLDRLEEEVIALKAEVRMIEKRLDALEKARQTA